MSTPNGKKVVRIAISIPNDGMTAPEGYGNRMLMMFHLGILQCLSHHGLKEYAEVKYDIPDCVEYQFFYSSVGRVLTPLARERLAEFAVQGRADYIFFIDDDMISPVDLFEKLVRHDVDIVAPLAFARHNPHPPVIYRVDTGFDKMQNMEYYVPKQIWNYPKGKLVRCDAVGFGAALIKTNILGRMKKPWFMSTTGFGEDILFCQKATAAGAKVYMDTSVELGHLGIPPVIRAADFERENNIDEFRKIHGEWKGYEIADAEMNCGKEMA